ncbi:hypothetical protein V5O48_015264 [Marasmius crinis-equi]|uniref:Uncharacterized protein n=1 Tax=Marasmius crinis-equi TaxID=585013 RepID=A0ABR3EV09_9AGAR
MADENPNPGPQGPQDPDPPPSPQPGPPNKKQKAFNAAFNKIKQRKKEKKQRKKRKGAFKVSTSEELLGIAKYFSRHNHPDLQFETVVLQGLAGSEDWRSLVSDGFDDEVVAQNFGGEDKGDFVGQCMAAFQSLIEKKPMFAEFLDHCAAQEKIEGFDSVISELNHVVRQVLYDNNHTLKEHLHKLLSPNPYTDVNDVQDLHPTFKADRDVSNDLICSYLLSRDDMLAYRDGDQTLRDEILAKYRADEWALDDDDLPAFLYDVKVATNPPPAPEPVAPQGNNSEPVVNPNTLICWRDIGLYRGPLAIRSGQCILTSPGSAGQLPKSFAQAKQKNPDNTKKMGITSVSAELICRICMALQFSLSSCQTWTETIGDFSFYNFYEAILAHLTEDKDFLDEVIAFWNKEIYGDPKGRIDKPKVARKARPESDGSVLRCEREAVRAVKAAEEARQAAAAAAAIEGAAATGGGGEGSG